MVGLFAFLAETCLWSMMQGNPYFGEPGYKLGTIRI